MSEQQDQTSAPDAIAAQRAEQAKARIEYAQRIAAGTVEPVVHTVAVFGKGEVVRLEKALEAARELQYAIEGIVIEIKGALNQADRLTRSYELATAPKPPATEANKPTVSSKGPMKILRMLLESMNEGKGCLKGSELARLCEFSHSTVRTYIPVLRDGGLVFNALEGFYGITGQGVELVLNTPEE